MAEDLKDSIRENAEAPAEAAADGQHVKQHPLPDQIEADRYLESKQAARKKGLGIKLVKLSPPGAA
ncbi:MAG: hypothetical protein GC159_13045 [Phycisphaera sp.]|nr:hypothetical protein [Phycisphaera sp.]